MSNPSTAIGEHGQLSGRFPDACQLQVGIAITKAALIRGERLGITGLKLSPGETRDTNWGAILAHGATRNIMGRKCPWPFPQPATR